MIPDYRRRDSALLVEFYSGQSPDSRGRSIENVWRFSLDELEDEHDYIQWLFPTRKRSAFHPEVPVLDNAAIERFRSPLLQERLLRSTRMMAGFYGFEIIHGHGTYRLRPADDFQERARNWLTPSNHNFLRLTRLLESLMILGQAQLASAWFDALQSVYAAHADTIGADTAAYWRLALSAK